MTPRQSDRSGERRKLLYAVPEVCELLSLKRSKIYELIATGAIEVVKIGAATRVPAESLDVFVTRLRGLDGAN